MADCCEPGELGLMLKWLNNGSLPMAMKPAEEQREARQQRTQPGEMAP